MTMTEMKTFLVALGHGTDTDTAQTALLTRAYLDLAGRRRWSWLEQFNVGGVSTTVGGISLSGFPTDVAEITSVNLSSGTDFLSPLTRISANEWEELNFLARDNGPPQYYAWVNRAVRLHPRADKVYTVEISYVSIPLASTFDAGGESPPFDERFHLAIPWKAAAWLAYRQRDWAQMSSANAEYERIVREMEQAEDNRDKVGHMAKTDFYDQVK